jgi:hypothetical protein
MKLEDLISEEEYARQRRSSLVTIRRERQRRKSPSFFRLGRKVYYHPDAIAKWLLDQECGELK